MNPMPPVIARHRKRLCGDCECGTNMLDPCATCPKGKWSKFGRCEPSLAPTYVAAKNFGIAVFEESKAIFSGIPAISEEETNRRKTICRQCAEWFRPSDERCAHPDCQCYVCKKTAWRSQKCPIGKW